MNEQQTERMLALLGSIADSLGRLAGQQDGDSAPDAVWPIEEYAVFDWAALGAQVIAHDTDGPTIVMWGGKNFKRRAPDNAFEPAIWYSHCVGKDAEGRNEYQRLVTFRKFKEDDVQPLGRKAERYVGQAAAVKPETGARTAAQPYNAPQQATAPVSATLPLEATADMERMFDELPSASAGLPPYTPPAAYSGPKVSKGATPDPEPATPKTPTNGATGRQAALGTGAVGGQFRNWAREFAARNPQYRQGRTDEIDMYHLLMSVGSFGITKIENDNLAEVIALLEDHVRAPQTA